MFDLSDPEAYWLNLTNIGLGIVTLACVVLLARGLMHDLWDRIRGKATVAADDHAFFDRELGFTMADGGEVIEKKKD